FTGTGWVEAESSGVRAPSRRRQTRAEAFGNCRPPSSPPGPVRSAPAGGSRCTARCSHHLAADSNGCPCESAPLLANGWPAAWVAEDPDAEATSPKAVYEAAQTYVASGLSVIPITAEEADKSPDSRRIASWKIYQLRPPRAEELRAWYDLGGLFGIAVV